MIVPEKVVHNFTYPITAISILANSALIFVILTTQNKHAIIMTDFGLIFFGFRFIPNVTGVGIGMALLFVALFYQTFVLLAFHYVYRYVLLCNPEWLRWIGAVKPWRNWITIAIIIDIFYIGGFMLAIKVGFLPDNTSRTLFSPVMKEMYNIDLFASNLPGYLGITYRVPHVDGSQFWSFWSLVSIFLVILLFFGSDELLKRHLKTILRLGFVIVFCIWKVRAAMREKQQPNSILQTLVPTLTSYIPLGSVFVFPLTGMNLGGWGTVSMMSTALFPLIDPFIVLFLVSGYRSRLPQFVQLMLSTSHASVKATTTQKTDLNTRAGVNERSPGQAVA